MSRSTSARRLDELCKALPSITQHVPSMQRGEREADELIGRIVLAEVPPRLEYVIPLGELVRRWRR